MKVKKFRGESFQDAIAQVKRELGNDAIIMGTETKREPGKYGLYNKTVIEVTAAAETYDSPPAPSGNFRAVVDEDDANSFGVTSRTSFGSAGLSSIVKPFSRKARLTTPPPQTASQTGEAAVRAEPQAAEIDVAQVISPIQEDLTEIRSILADNIASQRQWNASNQVRYKEEINQLREELIGMRRKMDDLVTTAPSVGTVNLPDVLARYHEHLRKHGLNESVSRVVLGKINTKGQVTESIVKGELSRTLPESQRIDMDTTSGPKVVALVGPTGVGKTTTIAKLASLWSIREKKRVAIVSSDTYRIGAYAQIKTFADIMKVPCVNVTQLDQLDAVLEKLKDRDLIFIDTYGCSPSDSKRLGELRDAITNSRFEIEPHLVLSATTSSRDLVDITSHFSGLSPKRLIFTKLDETRYYGGIYETVYRSQLGMSYVGIGQNVPDDVGFMSREQLSGLLI